MAIEMNIRGTQDEVKVRNPWAVALLPIITLGIYHLVWWYKVNRELRDYGQAKGTDLGQNPTNSVLALFPGGIIIIPALITYWNGFKRVQSATTIAGKEIPNGWIGLILYLLISPAMWAYMQVSLNHIWEAEADAIGGGATAAVEAPEPVAAPEGSVVPEPPATPEAPPEPPTGS